MTDRITLSVHHGDGAVSSIPVPNEDGSLEWYLRYSDPESIRFDAAMVVASFDYLISDAINSKEAIRRLRQMRAALSRYHSK